MKKEDRRKDVTKREQDTATQQVQEPQKRHTEDPPDLNMVAEQGFRWA